MNCDFAGCPNQATKQASRSIEGEEQDRRRTYTDNSSTLPMLELIRVCDEHVEEARKKYPQVEDFPA